MGGMRRLATDLVDVCDEHIQSPTRMALLPVTDVGILGVLISSSQ
jgi:hypothetical protein